VDEGSPKHKDGTSAARIKEEVVVIDSMRLLGLPHKADLHLHDICR